MNNILTSKIPLFFICNDFERALGLEKLLENYHIVCIDNNTALSSLKSHTKVFCLEEELGKTNPIFRNSNKLLTTTEVIEYIKSHSDKDIPNLIFFKIAPNIEQTCKENEFKILNTTSEMNRMFENKLSQYEILNPLGFFPKSKISILKNETYSNLSKQFGSPFVIQYDRGHTGSGTVFIANEVAYKKEQELFPQREAKFSEFINGDAWTLNACVTRSGIAYGGLCYQITGIPECTSKKGGTVGNDWSKVSELKEEVVEQIQNITEQTGKLMQKRGYRGLYGLDLVIDKSNKVYLIEINARQPASTGMHTKLMLKNNQIPLQLLHIAEFLFSEDDILFLEFINKILKTNIKTIEELSFKLTEQNNFAIKPINASQLIIRNSQDFPIKIRSEFRSGIYKWSNKKLGFIRNGYSIEDIISENEMLILAPVQNRIINPENEIGRIQAKYSQLKDIKTTKEIVNNIKFNLDIKNAT